MPYFVYNIQESPKKLEHLETFAKYREAKEFVKAKRAESGDIESIRMIFARNDVEAEKLLKTPREERVIGARAGPVNGPGEQLLAGAAGAVNQHRAVAVRDDRQELEKGPHRGAPADDVGKGVAALELAAKIFDQAEVAEGLDTPDTSSMGIAQDAGTDADG